MDLPDLSQFAQNGLEHYSFRTQLSVAFIGGFITSLTPCVYPLIPVTLALFGAGDNTHTWKRSLLLSLTFVLGITATFTTLGIIAATTGSVFGSLLGHPVVIASLATLLLTLALFNLDIFQIKFLAGIQTRASTVGRRGFLGAFLAGTVSGFVAAPCVGPVLVSILVVVAAVGEVGRGALLLISYSLGMGVLFIILGTFSGLLSRFPRSGRWMSAVKFFISVALIGVACFLTQPLYLPLLKQLTFLHEPPLLWSSAVVGIVIAGIGYKGSLSLLRAVGAITAGAALFLLIVPNHATTVAKHQLSPVESHWHESLSAALENAQQTNKIVMVDLYADWCAACKELEAITFVDPAVQTKLNSLVLARINFTEPTEETNRISEKYGVLGLPWILFLKPSGEPIKKSVVTGFLPPSEFIVHLDRVLTDSSDTR